MLLGVIPMIFFEILSDFFGENLKNEKPGQTRAPTPQRRAPSPWRSPTPQRGLPRRSEAEGGQISTLGYTMA